MFYGVLFVAFTIPSKSTSQLKGQLA